MQSLWRCLRRFVASVVSFFRTVVDNGVWILRSLLYDSLGYELDNLYFTTADKCQNFLRYLPNCTASAIFIWTMLLVT